MAKHEPDEPVEPNPITVGQLIGQLETCDRTKPVHFGCAELEFARIHDRGDHVQIEFGQTVMLTKDNEIVVDDHDHPRVSSPKRKSQKRGEKASRD